MKFLTAMAAMLIAGTTTFASANFSKVDPQNTFNVVQNNKDKFKLVYFKPDQGEVKINIYNYSGEKVYEQSVINSDGFSQPFNFESLPVGEYKFEVINPDGSKTSKIVKHGMANETLKANILNVNDGKRFRLAVLKYATSPVSVVITDDNDKVVFEETIKSSEGFRKIYDLTDSESSSFNFQITSGEYSVTVPAE
ncbi:T9SS type A sorting domain-containing protein [Fulvivirga ligni]|uniref:T9SS type A sorting domain-containing protein n=1 Tax=Fulvivirga ligni TaxID=2904246 RepID=UPI001F1E89EF|nr:T9SS type A sorting domain-containing protein [Fulvivirga ligni]UII22238.1 DUF3244 domain-containing protein [Fulvivirga ligni]